jgi:hypothetical protein
MGKTLTKGQQRRIDLVGERHLQAIMLKIAKIRPFPNSQHAKSRLAVVVRSLIAHCLWVLRKLLVSIRVDGLDAVAMPR